RRVPVFFPPRALQRRMVAFAHRQVLPTAPGPDRGAPPPVVAQLDVASWQPARPARVPGRTVAWLVGVTAVLHRTTISIIMCLKDPARTTANASSRKVLVAHSHSTLSSALRAALSTA